MSESGARASFPALGTTAVVCMTGRAGLATARAEVEREVAEIDRACSRFRPDSELVALNRNAGAETGVSQRLLEAVRTALGAAAASGGLVDPTIGRTLRLAGYDSTYILVQRRDGSSFRARFAPVAGWQQIQLDESRGTIRVPVGVELDLGATAKALAADRAARAAASAAGCGVLVSLGGDIAVAGEPPPDGWSVRVAADHRAALDDPGPTVALFSGGLASSGTAVRRWRAGRIVLHHIIDPRTGEPARTPWRTVTVAAASCVEANTASTAAVVLGEEAPDWLAERGLPARLEREHGGAMRVGGWPLEAP